jgi:hypothetical protein
MQENFNLPNLILLGDFGGNWQNFYEFVYQCFQEDFVKNRMKNFNGKEVKLKRYPLSVDNKEATFYHMTHEGKDEQNREPDLRRMERIRWPKYLMMNSKHPKLKVWRNKRGRDENILIFEEEESYLLVLADRGDYILPWTAYMVEHSHRKRKLIKEYEEYKKAEAAKYT